MKGQDVLFEHLTWRKDHKLASQRLQRKGNAKTQHTYHYNTLGQLEKDIYTYPGLGVTPTYTYGYDALGVLTNIQEQGNINGNDSWSTDLDALHRVSQETLDIEKDTKILLEGETEDCVHQVHVSANGGNRVEAVLEHIGDTNHWRAQLSGLNFGEPNRIKVTATSEEDIATDEVFNKLIEPYVVSSYDELGNLTRRYNALTGEGTHYTWDTWGRLINVACHTADGQTKTWTYRYDALGRRLETEYSGDQNITIQSFYDPEFEYLELGLKVGATTVWKQYGPDSSGYYGSLNGIGGLEGVINGKTGDSTGTINHITGNIVAYTDQGETHFLAGNIDNYGRLTGDYWLDEESSELIAQTTFWVLKNSRFRGRRVESNGLSYFGARYYNTETGSFLSSDPYGHDGSLDLYSYASADPVNYVDPDGRLSQPVNERTGSYLEGVGDVFKGYGDAAVGTAKGLYQVARHPVNTAKNLWTLGNKAVRNPSKAYNVIKTGISEKLETNRGAGELIGTALIGIATGSAISTGTKAGLAYASSRMAGTQAGVVSNAIPSRLARVVPAAYAKTPTLAAPSASEAWVTAASSLRGIKSGSELARRLTLVDKSGNLIKGPKAVIEFQNPVKGLASPVFRNNPGFIGRGRTAGGAPEFIIPNSSISTLKNVNVRIVP